MTADPRIHWNQEWRCEQDERPVSEIVEELILEHDLWDAPVDLLDRIKALEARP